MEQLRYINIIVITVIIVMEELKQTFLLRAGVLILDTARAEYIAGIMRHLLGELVRLYTRNIRCNKQFRSCALPFSDRVNVVCNFPKVVRNSFQRLLFCGFFLIQRPDAVFFADMQHFLVHITSNYTNCRGFTHALTMHKPCRICYAHDACRTGDLIVGV